MDIKIFTNLDNSNDEDKGICEKSYFIYYPNYFNKVECAYIKHYLDSMKNFKYNINPNNNGCTRLQKWYQMEGKYFCDKWRDLLPWWESYTYDKFLLNIQNKIQLDINNKTELGTLIDKYNITIPQINSCLINKYRDGNDYIAPHRDTQYSFGKYPTILGISIGESRIFKVQGVINNNAMKHGLSKLDKFNTSHNFDFVLEDGSLFIMAGASQKYFSHAITKSSTTNTRYSLTFREYIL